jgi:hypothetical protein
MTGFKIAPIHSRSVQQKNCLSNSCLIRSKTTSPKSTEDDKPLIIEKQTSPNVYLYKEDDIHSQEHIIINMDEMIRNKT